MSVTQLYKLSRKDGEAVSVDLITNAVQESVKHLDGLITRRGAKNLISKIDKLIGEHLDHIFIADQIGQSVADAPAKDEKALQNLIAFRAHVRSKKSESLSASAWKEYVKKYQAKGAVIPAPVSMLGAGPQAANVMAILVALKACKK